MSLRELKENRSTSLAEMRQIHDKAEGEKRDLSGEERKRFDTLEKEVRAIDARIADAERIAEFERHEIRGNSGSPDFGTDLSRFDLGKAVNECRSGTLSGLEAEVHSELARGREVRGVMVPTEIILGGETRAQVSGDPATGGHLVGTSMASMTDRRRPELLIGRMGARIMSGLTGNMDLPRLDASGSANWVAEHSNSTRSTAGFGKKTMSPKHVTAEYEVSRNMTLQSNEALNSILQSDLRFLLRQALDGAAISGGGTHEPTGIMSDPDVQNLQALDNEISSSGYEPLHFIDHINKLMISLDLDDVSGTRAFLMSRKVRAYARQLRYNDHRLMTPKDIFHEKPNFETSQIPDNLGSTNDQSGLIFGEWSSLYLGYWSGIDILPNPYHSDVASKGGLLLHAFLDADVVVRHPEAFVHTSVATGL